MDNTITTENNIQVYTNKLYELSDEFIELECNNDISNLNFRYMLFWCKNKIGYINKKDIYELDNYFMAYCNLCMKYNKNPTIELFSLFIDINASTISRWLHGSNRDVTPEYKYHAQKWTNICKSALVDDLGNSDKTSVNKIFISKAIYGLAETTPTNNPTTPGRYIDADTLPTLSLSDGQNENIIELSENS